MIDSISSFINKSYHLTIILMFFGKFDVEPLLTLAAVGFIKLWLFKSTRGCINLLFVMDLLSPETGRLPKIDCWPTLLPLLLLREVIGRFLIFGMLGITYRLTIKIILRILLNNNNKNLLFKKARNCVIFSIYRKILTLKLNAESYALCYSSVTEKHILSVK